MIDDEATIQDVDEAIGHIRAALVSAIDGNDTLAETNLRKRIDQLLEARMILTRDLPEAMSTMPVFSN